MVKGGSFLELSDVQKGKRPLEIIQMIRILDMIRRGSCSSISVKFISEWVVAINLGQTLRAELRQEQLKVRRG